MSRDREEYEPTNPGPGPTRGRFRVQETEARRSGLGRIHVPAQPDRLRSSREAARL